MTQSAAAANDSNDTCQTMPPGVATAAGAGSGVGGHPAAQVEVVEDPAAWVAFEGASASVPHQQFGSGLRAAVACSLLSSQVMATTVQAPLLPVSLMQQAVVRCCTA